MLATIMYIIEPALSQHKNLDMKSLDSTDFATHFTFKSHAVYCFLNKKENAHREPFLTRH